MSHFWADSGGKNLVSGGRWELVKCYGDLQGGMLREKAQKSLLDWRVSDPRILLKS